MPDNLLVTPVFARGMGLGNRLFSWARAKVHTYEHRSLLISPRWFRPSPGHLIRRTVSIERYAGQVALLGLFRTGPAELAWYRQIAYLLSRRTIRESSLAGRQPPAGSLLLLDVVDHCFEPLEGWQSRLRDDLFAITRSSHLDRIKSIGSIPIGINIRCGRDFRQPPADGAASEWVGWLQQTPLEWFIETLLIIRQAIGFEVPAIVVSDGDAKQLAPLLALPEVTLLRPTNAIVDLLVLSRTRLLLGSGSSSFSAWAAFLGQQTAITAPGHPLTNWGMRANQGQTIAAWHPRRPETTVLTAMIEALDLQPPSRSL